MRIETPLERAEKQVAIEKRKLQVTAEGLKLLPKEIPYQPWIVAERHNSSKLYMTFRVDTLEQLKELMSVLTVSSYNPVTLTLGYPYGSYTQNLWGWYWQKSPLHEVIQIQVEVKETVGRATARKAIKYYYEPSYKLESEKFGLNPHNETEQFLSGDSYYSRSEYPPQYKLAWKGLSPFK